MHVQTDQGTNLSSQWSAQSLWHPLHDESTMKEVNRLQFSLNVCIYSDFTAHRSWSYRKSAWIMYTWCFTVKCNLKVPNVLLWSLLWYLVNNLTNLGLRNNVIKITLKHVHTHYIQALVIFSTAKSFITEFYENHTLRTPDYYTFFVLVIFILDRKRLSHLFNSLMATELPNNLRLNGHT